MIHPCADACRFKEMDTEQITLTNRLAEVSADWIKTQLVLDISQKREKELREALQYIADQLEEHPACMPATSTEEELDSEGGDAAFFTHNLQVALLALRNQP